KHSQVGLPSVAELTTFLNTPLEESEKIPISQKLFDDSVCARPSDICTEDDISAVFKIGDGGLASAPFISVLETPDSSRTEAGYHLCWDDNIRKALRVLIPEGECIRNTKYHTETRNALPDFAYLITKRCVFRGEEKVPTSAQNPAIELMQKTVWANDSAPYILGYYANETVVTLVAIVHEDGQTRRIDLETVDLKFTVDRVFNLRRLINMCSILCRLAKMVHKPSPDFELVKRSDCTISFPNAKLVKKTYTCSNALARVQRLKMVYQTLKEANVPNTDSLVSSKDNVAFLEPVGLATSPNTIGSLKDCLLCILDATQKAHQIPIYHRDIRKENVIRSKDDQSKWFLIDWEDASTKPTFAQRNFARETHSPAVLEDDHGPEVDIWAVGYLIKHADATIPPEIRELADRICRDSLKLTALETRDLVTAVFPVSA
ncbi:hypothetical protein BT96DRAFT_1094877, partial [Gymnopus androsaceus JB14]